MSTLKEAFFFAAPPWFRLVVEGSEIWANHQAVDMRSRIPYLFTAF